MHAGAALGVSFMGLAHAIAQALGGRYGLPHGAMNALVLAPTLRFNEPVASGRARTPRRGARRRRGRRGGTARPLGGFERLRDFDVPQDELLTVAAAAVERPAARANPRRATAEDIEQILQSIF